MTAGVGRSISLTWNGSAVAGVREKGLTCNGEAIDVTSDEDSGKRTLLTVSSQDEVNISISGVTKSPVLRNAWMAGSRTSTAVLTFPDGAIVQGTFFLSNYKETGPYQDAITFECELLSSGAISYTPGA